MRHDVKSRRIISGDLCFRPISAKPVIETRQSSAEASTQHVLHSATPLATELISCLHDFSSEARLHTMRTIQIKVTTWLFVTRAEWFNSSSIIRPKRCFASGESWKYSNGAKNGVDAFAYNSAESFLTWTASTHDATKRPRNFLTRLFTTLNIVFITCCLLNVTKLSRVAFGVLTDYLFKNWFICFCLSNFQNV